MDEFAMQIMVLPEMPLDYQDPSYDRYLQNKEVLFRYDRPTLEQLYSLIRFEKADIEIIEFWEKKYFAEATRLIDLIKNEYDLDKE